MGFLHAKFHWGLPEMFNRILVVAAFVGLFLLWFAATANGQDPVKVAKAKHTYTIEIILRTTITPSPDNPVSDICDTCNGKGWVGDATIRQVCPTCDGSGKKKKTTSEVSIGWPPKKIEIVPTPKPFSNPYPWLDASPRQTEITSVTMYSIDPCPACDVFKQNEAPRLASVIGNHSFEVRTVDRNEHLGGLSFPVFVIRTGPGKPSAIDSKNSRVTHQTIASVVSRMKARDKNQ